MRKDICLTYLASKGLLHRTYKNLRRKTNNSMECGQYTSTSQEKIQVDNQHPKR